MKRTIAMLAVCALLAVQLTVPSAKAAGNVYFVAADKSVLPVNDETMPFWQNGYLYISSSIFTGMTRETLGISHVINTEQKVSILYSDGKAIWFEQGLTYGRDSEGNIYYPGAVVKNGNYFVPAAVVAKYFQLDYSVMDVPNGYLVWMRKQGSILTERIFADAATGPMNSRYQDYLKGREQTDETSPEPDGETEAPPTEVQGERVYLCLEAGETAAELLDVLDTYRAKATFFCGLEFLQTNHALVRRMLGSGHLIGLIAEADHPEKTVEQQLADCNQALAQITFGATRLVMVRGGDEEQIQNAERAGYCCLVPDVDRSERPLKTAANAASLLELLHGRNGSEALWLGDAASAAGLRAFLWVVQSEEGQCFAWRETV